MGTEEQTMKTISDLQELLSDALQSDLEHGVKSLNERASREFKLHYPELNAAIKEIMSFEEEDNK